MNFLQQAAQSAQTNEIPVTIQGAIALALLYVAREVPGAIKVGRGVIETRAQERKAIMKNYEAQIKQLLDHSQKLFEDGQRSRDQIAERDKQLSLNNETMNQSQRLVNERWADMLQERKAFQEERKVWVEERRGMTEKAQAREIAFEALTKQYSELAAERDRLLIENRRLTDRVAELEGGSGGAPPTLRVVPPVSAEDSSSSLPGMEGVPRT